MDGHRFDELSRRLAASVSRRATLKGAAVGVLGALGLRAGAEAQVSVAQCNNVRCKNDPGKCNDGCVCCTFANGNNRCLPPGKCRLGVETCPPDRPVVDPVRGCVEEGGGPPVCTTGNDPESGDPWVVCRADASTAWVGHANEGAGGTYHPIAICQGLGYAGYDLFGGTFGDVCGYDESETSCASPGSEIYDGGDNCGDPGGDELCGTVHWRCVA